MSESLALLKDNSDLERKRNLWFKLSQTLTYAHWILGIAGVVFSTLAAAKGFDEKAAPILSLLAAVCVSVISFTSPKSQASRFLSGYLILDPALRRYKKGLIDERQLEECADKAERLVHPDLFKEEHDAKAAKATAAGI